jgi:hypothetical protein
MRITFKLSLLGLVLICGLTFLACGASSPTSPSEGATIVGSVNATAGTSSSSVHSTSAASASGITVSVMGTNLSTTTDSSGQFVLAGVPEGTVTVRFQARGLDATLEISGLVAGQTLTISVHVSGSQATLEGPPSITPGASPSPTQQQCAAVGGKAEIEGTITATAASSITVFQEGEVKGNYVCQVSGATRIRKGNKTFTLGQLQIGGRVHVSGTGLGMSGGMCQVRADEIKVQ